MTKENPAKENAEENPKGFFEAVGDKVANFIKDNSALTHAVCAVVGGALGAVGGPAGIVAGVAAGLALGHKAVGYSEERVEKNENIANKENKNIANEEEPLNKDRSNQPSAAITYHNHHTQDASAQDKSQSNVRGK